jgi:hypothetical protein
MPLAEAAKPLKRLKTAMGSYWKKLAWIWVWRHVGLGLAPRRLGIGTMSAWGRRHGRAASEPSQPAPYPCAEELRPLHKEVVANIRDAAAASVLLYCRLVRFLRPRG